MSDALEALLGETRAYLQARPDCEAYLSTVDATPGTHAGRPDLAALDCLCPLEGMPALSQTTAPASHRLTEALLAAREALSWFQVYQSGDPVGKGKIDRTAVSMLAGPGAPYAARHGQVGFYYLLEGVEYAAHAHAPREIYAILSGRARYWSEAGGWVTRGPGDVIHTPEWSWHAMTTAWEPVLILWAWVGEELSRAPRLRAGDHGALPPGALDGIDPARAPQLSELPELPELRE